MSKILYAAAGILLVLVTALFLFIRSNAFITPSPSQEPTPTTVALPTPIVIEMINTSNTPSPNIPSTAFECPQSKWINCMPGLNVPDKRCAKEYLDWAEINCPGFMGAAY